jgi:hypothetical protein
MKISCIVVQRFKESLPKMPDNGQVEIVPFVSKDNKVLFLVFEYVGDDWILKVAV